MESSVVQRPGGELAEPLAELELVRDADDGVERGPAPSPIAVAAALAVALRHVEERLDAEVHPVEERDLRARNDNRVLAVDHAVRQVA